MKNTKYLGGLDYFKIVAALFVIAVHTSPLSSFHADADFILTRVIARIAVPFFFMVTGYFILPQYLFHKSANKYSLFHFSKKILFLYFIAIIFYLPVNIYAGHFEKIGLLKLFSMIVFDGTFYHLWYLPASIIGVWIVFLLSRYFSFKYVLGISLLLYSFGLLGDSYFGLISNIPILSSIYDIIFHIFSYTRNGIFYSPIFLVIGAYLGNAKLFCTRKKAFSGFTISMFFMIIEGLILHYFKLQRHDSMYIALLPCMFFLYELILSFNIKPVKALRSISTSIYLIHPFIIIIVRIIAKAVHLTSIFVDNSIIHYLTVCILSCIFAVLLEKLSIFKKKQNFYKGRAWIELNRENLHHNVKELNTLLSKNCQIMPVIKANAYGHGAILIAKELNILGIKAFCVSSVLEGVELRKNGIQGEILILGYTHPKQFPFLKRYHLTQTIIDYSYAKTLANYGKKIKVHIKIDTGMHRLGECSEKIDNICKIFNFENLQIEGLYTHLCAADTTSQKEKAFTIKQETAFFNVISQLKERGYTCPKIHLQASYGLLNYPNLSKDYARIGIALYGILSNRIDLKNCRIDLRPVLSIKARVAVVKNLFKGEAAGYNLQYVAKENTKIAILTIGYGDGIPRSLSCNIGTVLINGMKATIIGLICMDQTLVDISNIPNVKSGDTAVIIGKSGNSEITIYDLAEQTKTITNELLSQLGERLERIMI